MDELGDLKYAIAKAGKLANLPTTSEGEYSVKEVSARRKLLEVSLSALSLCAPVSLSLILFLSP